MNESSRAESTLEPTTRRTRNSLFNNEIKLSNQSVASFDKPPSNTNKSHHKSPPRRSKPRIIYILFLFIYLNNLIVVKRSQNFWRASRGRDRTCAGACAWCCVYNVELNQVGTKKSIKIFFVWFANYIRLLCLWTERLLCRIDNRLFMTNRKYFSSRSSLLSETRLSHACRWRKYWTTRIK